MGEQAFIDHTYLHFSGFADTRRKAWLDRLLRALGVEESKMPRIVPPWDLAGGLTKETAEACGKEPRQCAAARYRHLRCGRWDYEARGYV